MKSLLVSLFLFIAYQQVIDALPNATYFCFLKDENTMELQFHLYKNDFVVAAMEALQTNRLPIDQDHCKFKGSGVAGSPYMVKMDINLNDDDNYDPSRYCGVDRSGNNIYSWLFRVRSVLNMNSADDMLYRVACNPTFATNKWIEAIGVRAADIAEQELEQTACMSMLNVWNAATQNASTDFVLGDNVIVVANVKCLGRSNIFPTGIQMTDLWVSSRNTFPSDYSFELVDSSGCPVDGHMKPSRPCAVENFDPNMDYQYGCGLINIKTFVDPIAQNQNNLFFKAKLDFCFDGFPCPQITCPASGRKKRAAEIPQDLQNVTKEVEIVIEPYRGAFSTPAERKSGTFGHESCLESKLFIGVFVAIVVMLVMVTALSIFLFTRIGKSRRFQGEMSGKANPAF